MMAGAAWFARPLPRPEERREMSESVAAGHNALIYYAAGDLEEDRRTLERLGL